MFSYVEFCLWDAMDDSSNFQRNFSTGEVEVEGSVIYHKTEYRERRNHYAVFWANCPVTSFDTTRDAFCGCMAARQTRRPSAPGTAPAALPTAGHRWVRCTSMSPLPRGESRSILFGLGYIENPQEEKFIAPGRHQQEPAPTP